MASDAMENRVLIIDDDAHLRESLAESLELEGFDCCQAANAKAGIESARKNRPQTVIMDIQLPDSSGFQICQELRRASEDFFQPKRRLKGSPWERMNILSSPLTCASFRCA